MITIWDDVIKTIMREREKHEPKDNPGDCETCGFYAFHLIDGMCASCREKYQPDEIARRAGV